MTLPQRFWNKICMSGTHFYNNIQCWEWLACSNPNGYGQFKLNGKKEYAHRLSYEDKHGIIPVGLELDHLCRNTSCVNPQHLQAVTHPENIRRGLAGFVGGLRNRIKTHCPQGHEYNLKNTYVDSKEGRHCRSCGKIRAQQYKQHKNEVSHNV